ncbi:hypothetical protein Tco_1361659 [Tanacetum coccineum]
MESSPSICRWPSHFNLGNLPTYYTSLYMMSALVLQKLESIRNKFSIGADQGEKKCLASKKMGGLGIGSIHGLNIGLLFKWVWRLLTHPSDLWARVVINIHGSNGGIFDDHARYSSASPWCSIMKSINNIKRKDVLLEVVPSELNLILFLLPSGMFLSLIRWKGIDAGLVLCPIFQDDVESVNHLFFNCDLAKDLWDLLAKWWDLNIPVCANILEWYSWLDSLCASIKACLDSFGEHAVHCKELSGFKYTDNIVRDPFDIM